MPRLTREKTHFFLKEGGGCEVMEERQLDGDALRNRFLHFRKHPHLLQNMADNARKMCILNATENLTTLVESMISRRSQGWSLQKA